MPNERSDPRRRQPGPAYPGPSTPGPSQPGPSQPGPSQPGPSQPGPAQPGPSQPGSPNPTLPLPQESDPPNEDAERERARALLLPVPESQPGVGEVAPGRPDPVRPVARVAAATDERGVRCWNCSVENRSDRIFCRNCGVELNRRPAEVPVPEPTWWQRFRDRLNDVNWFAVGAGLLALLLVLAAVLLARPLFHRYQDQVSTPVAVPPAAVDASNTDPAHPPASAFDGVSNTWWGPGFSGNSRGQFLRAIINPTDLRAVRITPGVSPRPELRDQQARPHKLTLVVFDAQGRRTLKNVTLKDYTPKLVRIRVDQAVQVLLVLGDGFGTSDAKEIAIAEVELYRY